MGEDKTLSERLRDRALYHSDPRDFAHEPATVTLLIEAADVIALLEAPNDEVVEKVAEALCRYQNDAWGPYVREMYSAQARAALSALNKAGQTPAFTQDKQT